MSDIQWRFPGNNYTTESGLDTPDMETFKRDPISSLARELVQNSIDARKDKSKPVVVEFQIFDIPAEDIPGRDRVVREIEACQTEWARHTKISTQLQRMRNAVSQPTTTCLRSSDFNTNGLTGVSGKEKKGFYLLTKGSGISNKEGTSGGSKGIGKFASFVASEFNMVFYSTVTIDDEVGYQGICKLCSASMPLSEEKTQGIGYYGVSDQNHPVLSEFSLDPAFTRKKGNTGTDVYVVGFRKERTWNTDVISKILDSFLAAIIFGDLEITVQEVVINRKTIHDIVYSVDLVQRHMKKAIIAQYELLSDATVYKKTLTLRDLGQIDLFIKGYTKEHLQDATQECVMVRYPYMKIRVMQKVSIIPCSVMCVIGDNKLNEILRDIENPQHTDWEQKRIADLSERKEIGAIISEMYKMIQETIDSYLLVDEARQTDFEGASDYLPEIGNLGDGVRKEVKTADAPTLLPPKRNRMVEKIGALENDDAISLLPDVGSHGEGEDSPIPDGTNHGSGGSPHDSPEYGGKEDGDNDILTRQQLSGIQYHFFVIDKNLGKYAVSFESPYDYQDCQLILSLVDDAGGKTKVSIRECRLNGNHCVIQNETVTGFSIFKNMKCRFELITNMRALFACEVKLYAIG